VEGGAELFVTCAWDDAARSFDVEVVTCAPSTGAVTAWHARDVTAPASVSFPNWYERAQMALCGVDAANHFAFAFATPSADVAKLKWRWHERFVQGRGVSGGGGEKNDANRSADAANPEPSNPRRGVDRALMPARLDAPVLERAGGQLAGTVVLAPSTRSFVGEDPSSAAEKEKIFTPPAALAAFASRLSALNAALRRRCKRDAIALASLRRTTDFANAALREAAETRERRDGDVAASVALLLNSKKRRVRALEEDLANWRERAEALEDERDELKKQLRERRLGGDSRSSTPKREEDHSERSDDRSDDRSREDRTSEDEDEDGVAGGGVSVSGSGLGLDAPPRAEDTNTPRAADLESKVAPRKRAREEGGDPFPSSQGPSQRSQGPSQRVGSQRVGSQRGRGRAPGKRTVADDLGDELFDM
jgi:hypothetical protein